MFEKISPEYQVNKRIRSFLLHCATQQNIEPQKTKLLFKCAGEQLSVQLYEGSRYIKDLALPDILDFFGKDYLDHHKVTILSFLHKLASKEQIPILKLYVVICEAQGTIGTHVYEGASYRKKIPTLDLVIHFLKERHEQE